MRIRILLYEGFDDLDAIAPYEVLSNAAAAGADIDVRLVTRTPADTVTSSHNVTLIPQGTLGDDKPNLLVVPGGAWRTRSDRGAWGEIQRGDLPKALAALREQGTAMASVCTGAMLLSAAGITRGRRATTHHSAIEALREEGARIVDARVVDDGDLITSGGVTAGIDMALWLVEREFGRTLADQIADGIEHERRGHVALPPSPTPAAAP